MDEKSEREDPILVLQPIALWIGELKRRRHAILDRQMAGLLMAIVDEVDEENVWWHESRLELFEAVLEPRLGPEAWELICLEAAKMVEQDGTPPIPVVYDWVQDVATCWSAKLRDGVILISGPLLDFPVGEVEQWNRRTTTLLVNGKMAFSSR